jgi:hypothetical protein
LRKQERARQVGVDHLLPLVERHRLRLRGPRDAGVVDQDVDLSVGGDRLVDHGLHLLGRGHVADHAFDRETARAKRFKRRRQPLLAPRANHQRRARFGKAFRHLLAEPARSARDDGDTAAQIVQLAQ